MDTLSGVDPSTLRLLYAYHPVVSDYRLHTGRVHLLRPVNRTVNLVLPVPNSHTDPPAMPSKWVPLEASPEVFNDWSRPLGLPDSPLSFQDLFSLDPEFLQFIPQPVKAVLLLFPSRGDLAAAREQEESAGGGEFKGDVWWIKQTIPNACGSIGLLHALLNLPKDGPYGLKPDSPLLKFKAESLPLDPVERAKLLDNADFFQAAHTAAASSGQSAVPTDLDVDTHFITFIEALNDKGERRVVEMDGGRNGPFDRGACDDLLKDTAKIVQEKYIDQASGDINFNMIVLAGEADD